jgi:hypothetical protein
MFLKFMGGLAMIGYLSSGNALSKITKKHSNKSMTSAQQVFDSVKRKELSIKSKEARGWN